MLFLLFTAIAALCVGVVWAAMNGPLTISGTANLGSAEVMFDNFGTPTASNGGVKIPQVGGSGTNKMTFEIELPKLDDWASFTFDIKNTGSVDVEVLQVIISVEHEELGPVDEVTDLQIDFTGGLATYNTASPAAAGDGRLIPTGTPTWGGHTLTITWPTGSTIEYGECTIEIEIIWAVVLPTP